MQMHSPSHQSNSTSPHADRVMLTTQQCASVVGGKLIGLDIGFSSVCHDGRHCQPGALYVAIVGERFDGHDFIQQAQAAGAVALLVSKPVHTNLAQIQVKDSIIALGQLAHHWRMQFDCPLIAITGSCGKTTTRECLASILAIEGPVLTPHANLNNTIGLPLTLLRLRQHHRAAVVEIGANRPGEIAQLTQIAAPTVAIITCVAAVHLEGFGDVEGVMREKSQLFHKLPKTSTAIYNADDHYAAQWHKQIQSRLHISFGQHAQADVCAREVKLDQQGYPQFKLSLPNKATVNIKLKLLGLHNVMNALAAAAAAYALEVSTAAIKMGLTCAQPFNKRLVREQLANGCVVIDDTYNASPVAVKAAIELLAQASGQRILVLADMGELGKDAKRYHQQMGEHARAKGLDGLYAYGPLSQHAALAFGDHGQHFQTQDDLIKTLKSVCQANTTVLIKGSRAQHMEHVVQALLLNKN